MEKLQAFHKTKQGYITFGVVELILAYVLASIAIDTANMFAYVFSALMTIGAILNFISIIKSQPNKVKAKR